MAKGIARRIAFLRLVGLLLGFAGVALAPASLLGAVMPKPPWEAWLDPRELPRLPPGDQVLLRSSHCPSGCRFDRTSDGDPRFLRIENGEAVIFEEAGAGAVVRIWMTQGSGVSAPLDPAIRLVKGAYDEPAAVAYRDGDDVTDSYLRCLRVLMAGSGYPMVASHDPAIIDAVPALRREFKRGVDAFEYQMLYGIRDAEQRRLVDDGNHVRVYVPFGTEWYGYFVRRLAERPANLTFFLRSLVSRN